MYIVGNRLWYISVGQMVVAAVQKGHHRPMGYCSSVGRGPVLEKREYAVIHKRNDWNALLLFWLYGLLKDVLLSTVCYTLNKDARSK